MVRGPLRRGLALLAALLLTNPAPAQLVISEFLASNAAGLRDEDGDLSDWIEIHNPTTSPVNLDGWFLTDSSAYLPMWRFPATNVAANARMLIFASGKNRALRGAPLHTSFRLKTEGGYLALFRPDGTTVASAYSYLHQFPDISFGQGFALSPHFEPLIPDGAHARYLIPTDALPDAWRGGAAYTESPDWKTGILPAGYAMATGPVRIAYSIAGNTAGNQAYSGALGMDFDVAAPIQITDLGCFDDGSDGITRTITVELWQRDDNGTPGEPNDDSGIAVLASLTFASDSEGDLTNGLRFKALASPLTLANGAYTIVAHGYGSSERNGNRLPLTLDDGGGALQFVGRSRYGKPAGTFPQTVDVLVGQYAAGTFAFRALPQAAFPTDLQVMRDVNASACFRVHFSATNVADYGALLLHVNYDDGFVAWLNGTEIARRNAPAAPAWNSTALTAASADESIDVSAFASALIEGDENILAIQGLNVSADDVDFGINATLRAQRRTAFGNVYFLAPSPGEANDDVGVAWPRVVINEIHSDPPNSKSTPAEFIELYNPLPVDVDVSGWTFSRGVSNGFPAGTVIPSRGYVVVAENPAVVVQQFGVVALGPWSGSLANEGETLQLLDAAGAVVDEVSYGLGFPWPTVGELPGHSLQLLNEGLDHDLGGSWRSALPTPGARNSVATGNAPPQIRQVQHSPQQPGSGQVVTLTAKITDPDGVAGAVLEYQIVEPGAYIRVTDPAFATSWNSVAMRDDGSSGDRAADDSVFTAVLPANEQTHRRLVRYRITATDALGNFIRVPYADDPSLNFAYFVYDGVPAWRGAIRPSMDAPVTFDTNVMRQVRAFHLISRNEDVMDSQYNAAYDNGLYNFEGAVVADGEVYDHVGYRIAGQNSTYLTGKNKWKFQFNRGHWFTFRDDRGNPLSAKRESVKFSALTEPWAAWNRGLAGLDEVVAFRLYNLAGVAAPISAYVHFRVIDHAVEASAASQYEGDLWGLYLGFEEYDQEFKEVHQLPDGNLFLLQPNNNRLGAQGAGQPENLTDLYAFRSSSTGYNASSQPLNWWRTNVNLPAYYSWRAITEAINDTDIREGENVAYFRNPTNGLWSIHPWDCDLLYEQLDRWGVEGTQSQSPYEQIRRCLGVPELQVEFKNRARELQDLLLNGDQIGKLVEEVLGFITLAGPAQPGFVEVDRRMWDWNPRTLQPPRSDARWGLFYRTPFPIPDMGRGPPQPFFRMLSSPDFAGQVAWVTNFIVSDPHGGARLATLASDAAIPATPGITYVGPTNYPADGLIFQTTPFDSPSTHAFAAIQWRLAEVYDPSITNYVPGKPHRYEIETTWDSGELASFTSQITIPLQFVRQGSAYSVRVKHKDATGRWSHWSAPVQFTAGTAGVTLIAQSLIVSELMYNPPAEGLVSGDAFEFIELKNVGPAPLDLSGLTFSDGISFTFTNGTVLPPGTRFLLVRDAANFADKYPGVTIHGVYTGKLDDGGETVTLSHPVGGTVFSFTYDNAAPWSVAPDGHGFSLVPVNANAAFDHGNPANWRASAALGGSPGAEDPTPAIPGILINELLTHTDLPQVDSIELFNPLGTDVNIGGWFLSDDVAQPKKYRIPDGTMIPANGYLVFDEADFGPAPGNTNGFRLSSHGESIYLFSAAASTNLTGYSHGWVYESAANGVSFGRYVNSVGEEQFPAQISLTLGGANAGPRIGPVVINEIRYPPSPGGDDYVELRNITSANVLLFDTAHPTNTWKLSGIGYTFPTNLLLGASQFLLLVPIEPAVFRVKYGIPGSTQIIGPYLGALQNDGESLRLQRPDTPDTNGLPYITVDAVRYSNRAPWPMEAGGYGRSLQRRSSDSYGDDPISWAADTPTPGAENLGTLAPSITAHPTNLNSVSGAVAVFVASASGLPPIGWQWRKDGMPIAGATEATLSLAIITRQDAGSYAALATNAFGAALSEGAVLRVLVPQWLASPEIQTDGTLRLFSQDSDGGLLSAGFLSGFTVDTSSNLVDWVELPSALTVTNGQLLLHDTEATEHPVRFYRIIER